MKLVEQRIELPGQARISRLHIAKDGGCAHRVDDVLPLGSISNVHGIVSNGHHMYESGVEWFYLRLQQTNVRPSGRIESKPVHRRFCPTNRLSCINRISHSTVQQTPLFIAAHPPTLHAPLLGSSQDPQPLQVVVVAP